MAEHDEKIPEINIEEMFKKLDSDIKVPVIPNVQNVFDKAEKKKTKILPFRKYSGIVAAAAAVLILVVAVPVFNGASSEMLPQESDRKDYSYMADDVNDAVEQAEAETEVVTEERKDDGNPSEANVEVHQTANEALRTFFTTNASVDNVKQQSGAVAHEKVESDEPKGITEEISENRFINLTIEKERVSVLIHDVIEEEEEKVSSFWVGGTYEGSYLEGKYYFINMFITVDEESLEDGSYLPKAGDEETEEYTIPEESIFVSEEIEEGVIRLLIEINIETGEYKIYASLI